MPLISVIVPVYNTEKYLAECINSLTTQTYRNIEILLINDGSTDSSEKICKQFLLMDDRIKYYSQTNNGVSSARNKGLDIASGEYIAFVDSDDYVSDDFLEQLYKNIDGYDISICGLFRFGDSTNLRSLLLDIPSEISHDDLYRYVFCNNNIGGYLCNKLFSGQIVRAHNIRLNTTLSIGEDMVWIATYLKYVQYGFYIPKCLYYYRINSASALQNSYTTKTFNPKHISNLDASNLMYSVLEGESSIVFEALSYRFVRTSMWLFFNMLKCSYFDKNILNRIHMTIRLNLRSYLNASEAKLLEKFVAIGLSVSSSLTFKIAKNIMKAIPSSFINKYLS
jgi:glycosyltransferase involved in cell wall biosynthesis